MNTILGRYNFLIESRKRKIREIERMLEKNDTKHNPDALTESLKIEKDCLKNLLVDDYFQQALMEERKTTLEKYCC